jgi:hypothetical protein
MIALCANCSCSRGRRTCLLAALQFEYREADRTTPTEAPAWWSPRPNSCQPLLVLQLSSSSRRRGRDDAWLDRLRQGIISAQGCRHCFPAARVEVCSSALAAGFGSTKTGQSGAVLFRRQQSDPELRNRAGPGSSCTWSAELPRRKGGAGGKDSRNFLR